MRAETQSTIEAIRKSLTLLGQRMDWQTAPHRLEEMNAMIEAGDLWSDPARAQKLMRERQALSDAIETYRRIDDDLSANAEMVELAEAEGDPELVAEAEANLKSLAQLAAQKELEALLNGEADANDRPCRMRSKPITGSTRIWRPMPKWSNWPRKRAMPNWSPRPKPT